MTTKAFDIFCLFGSKSQVMRRLSSEVKRGLAQKVSAIQEDSKNNPNVDDTLRAMSSYLNIEYNLINNIYQGKEVSYKSFQLLAGPLELSIDNALGSPNVAMLKSNPDLLAAVRKNYSPIYCAEAIIDKRLDSDCTELPPLDEYELDLFLTLKAIEELD